MSVSGSETRAWELVKEGLDGGGGGPVARQPTDQRRMLIGLCVSGERVNSRSVNLILDHGEEEDKKEKQTKTHTSMYKGCLLCLN